MYCSKNLSKCYHFEPADRLCEEFIILVNEPKKDEKISDKEKYPWLPEDSDERKYMTDKEILDKYIDLDMLCLTESVKERSERYDLQIQGCI